MADIHSDSPSLAHVEAAVARAVNGDTVFVPAGSAMWTATLSLGLKAITLKGAGIGKTVITHQINGPRVPLITFTADAGVPSRISGMEFQSGTFDRMMIRVDAPAAAIAYRVDRCKFKGARNCVFVEHLGLGAGLIDHCIFEGGLAAEMIRNLGSGINANVPGNGWDSVVTPGGSAMLFIEDCTFTNTEAAGNPAYFFGCCAVQGYYGARTVFRHNTCQMAQVDEHGTAGSVGARWWEIYNNEFIIIPNGNQSDYVLVRAGSGVIFGNATSGSPNGGAGKIGLVEEDAGNYPQLYQIGRGKNQTPCPAYVWGNAPSMTVTPDGMSVQLNRDYFATKKPDYAPYVYPHPLTAAAQWHADSSNRVDAGE